MNPFDTTVPFRDDAPTEKRHIRRNRVLKTARLIYNAGQAVADAVVRDVSDSGMRLILGDTTGIPRDFLVNVHGSEGMRQGHTVWRTPTELGIALR